jgi:hypothetical protein
MIVIVARPWAEYTAAEKEEKTTEPRIRKAHFKVEK